MIILRKLTLLISLLLTAQIIFAAESGKSEADESTTLTHDINNLKQRVIELNRDLFIMQEELLFPAETQLAVFLSVDSASFFTLDAVELRLDNETVTSYLYTRHQLEALARGGVQRLWVGNIKQGDHELTAFFKGLDNEGRAIERAVSISFNKKDKAAMLELKVLGSESDMRPHFSIQPWSP